MQVRANIKVSANKLLRNPFLRHKINNIIRIFSIRYKNQYFFILVNFPSRL